MAASDVKMVKGEKIGEASASYVFKNAYDVIRSPINALMALEGCKSYSHVAIIAYARDRLFLPDAKVSKLNKFRRLRNNIQYRAQKTGVEEAEEIIEFMKDFVPEMEERLKQRRR